MPGVVIARLLRTHHNADWLLTRATEVSISLSFWPLLFLFSSTSGFVWAPQTARWFAIGISLSGFVVVLQRIWKIIPRISPRFYKSDILSWFFALQLLAIAWTRYVQSKSLLLPNWVDPVHHVMIVRILASNGFLPLNYEPFIPNSHFFYHWGYHIVQAWFAWLSGRLDPFEIAQDMLFTGQILNVLVAFPLYAVGRTMFDSRRAGLFCSVLGMLVSWFPAYYISWGRYTQLAGVIVCMMLGVELWRLRQRPSGARLVICTILLSGAFLIHVRVLVFCGILFALLAFWLIIERQWKALLFWSTALLLSITVTSPWLIHLLYSTQLQDALNLSSDAARMQMPNPITPISWSLVWAPMNRELLSIATAGLGWLLMPTPIPLTVTLFSVFWFVVVFMTWMRQMFGKPVITGYMPWKPILLIFLWSLVVILMLNYRQIPWLSNLWLPFGIIDNNSAIITLFVPLSIVGGGLLAWVSGQITSIHYTTLTTAILLIFIAVLGMNSMQSIVNPITTIVDQGDLDALHWIREETPMNAKFAIALRKWAGDTYAGVDGGYWISVLTDRSTILPPAIYTLAMPYKETQQMNQFFAEWIQAGTWTMEELHTKLRHEGVTYLYITSRNVMLKTEQLMTSSFFRRVYQNPSVTIFELR